MNESDTRIVLSYLKGEKIKQEVYFKDFKDNEKYQHLVASFPPSIEKLDEIIKELENEID